MNHGIEVYGAFETLSDLNKQRELLALMGRLDYDEGDDDDEEEVEEFQWWWEATVPEVEREAEEAEGLPGCLLDWLACVLYCFDPGLEMDKYSIMSTSHEAGHKTDTIRWIGVGAAQRLQKCDSAIFVDVREWGDLLDGHIPGAHHIPMSSVMNSNIIHAISDDFLHNLLTLRRHQLVIVYSRVATPFSRCRAFCRNLLHVGNQCLDPKRFRRLRGGMFGWRHRGGPVTLSITITPPKDDRNTGQNAPATNQLNQEHTFRQAMPIIVD